MLLRQIFLFSAGIICILAGQTLRLLKCGIKRAYVVENINYRYRSLKHFLEKYLGCYVSMTSGQLWPVSG